MSSSTDFGEKHSYFRFRFATNTLASRQREEIAESERDAEMRLKLSGFPADDALSTGWRVQPLRIPPIVSKQCIFYSQNTFNIYFIYRSTKETLMITVNQRVLVLHIFLY